MFHVATKDGEEWCVLRVGSKWCKALSISGVRWGTKEWAYENAARMSGICLEKYPAVLSYYEWLVKRFGDRFFYKDKEPHSRVQLYTQNHILEKGGKGPSFSANDFYNFNWPNDLGQDWFDYFTVGGGRAIRTVNLRIDERQEFYYEVLPTWNEFVEDEDG